VKLAGRKGENLVAAPLLVDRAASLPEPVMFGSHGGKRIETTLASAMESNAANTMAESSMDI
jgi:hypothetical protein